MDCGLAGSDLCPRAPLTCARASSLRQRPIYYAAVMDSWYAGAPLDTQVDCLKSPLSQQLKTLSLVILCKDKKGTIRRICTAGACNLLTNHNFRGHDDGTRNACLISNRATSDECVMLPNKKEDGFMPQPNDKCPCGSGKAY